jgi:archaellum biogenesis protein FlaJ (TadC family)
MEPFALESAVLANVNHDLGLLKDKQKFVYERVPNERIDQYQSWRKSDLERDQYLVNRRFPELDKAREAYQGKDADRSPLKNQHA